MKNILVIFGGTGDLSQRYLIPAVHSINNTDFSHSPIHTVIIGRRDWSEKDFSDFLIKSTPEHDTTSFSYLQMDITNCDEYSLLDAHLKGLVGNDVENLTFYLSVGPDFFEVISHHLAQHNLHNSEKGERKIIIEKPFGRDLRTATILNMKIQEYFNEKYIYRIDHYLGKNFVQDLQDYRFSHEDTWSGENIQSIEILANESLSILDRWEYYDSSGAIRDMIQNHLLQLLAIISMRNPRSQDPEDIRDRKMQALHDISPFLIDPRHDIILGQYAGYRNTEGVKNDSRTETFARICLHIDNPLWKDTDIFLQTGKGLHEKNTQVRIHFRDGKMQTFGETPENKNNSYSRLISHAMQWNQTLFVRWDSLKAAWQVVNELIHCRDNCPLVYNYEIGSTGPHTL